MADLETLGLERKRVESLAIAYEGYGRWSSDQSGDSATLESAASVALAAVYRCLVEPSRARKLFRQAANLYRRLQLPYWVVLAVCGSDDGLLIEYWENTLKRDFVANNPTQVYYELLAISRLAISDTSKGNNESSLSKTIDSGYPLAPNPVGRLSLPLRLYFSLFSTILQMQKPEQITTSTIRRPLTNYLRRVSEVVEAAQADHYHWTHLQSGILPIEPEVIAACSLLDTACRKYLRVNLVEFAGGQLRPIELIPVQIAIELSEPPKANDKGKEGG